MTTQGTGADGDRSAQHPQVDRLADYVGDCLTPGDATEVEQHVSQCDTCQATVSDLTGVSTMLRSAPAELPIPADVAARITASVENLADSRAAELDTAHEAAGSGPIAWFRKRLPRTLVAAASAGVLAIAGYAAVTSADLGGSDSDTSAADSAGEAAQLSRENAGKVETPDEAAAPEDADVAEEGADGLAAATAALPSEIQAQMRDIYDTGVSYRAGCGTEIAIEQDMLVAGSAELGGGVLIVLEDPADGLLYGWLVPTCNSQSGEAIVEVETIPVPSQ